MGATVACVLKSGGAYDFGHVARLAKQVREIGGAGDSFLCLTDDKAALNADFSARIDFSWPGWWAKIALLRWPGPMLYIDLDVNVIGDLGPLRQVAAERDFVMCRGFWGAEDPNPFNSSIMGWRADAPRHLYDLFASDPEGFIATHSKMPGAKTEWGDQGFIAKHYGGPIDAWQDLLPGMVASFKRGALMGEAMGACLVLCSHGKPRPWDAGGADEWLAKRRRAA